MDVHLTRQVGLNFHFKSNLLSVQPPGLNIVYTDLERITRSSVLLLILLSCYYQNSCLFKALSFHSLYQ